MNSKIAICNVYKIISTIKREVAILSMAVMFLTTLNNVCLAQTFKAGFSDHKLENSTGKNYVVFEFPNQSAEELYETVLTALRNCDGKLEVVKNTSIDRYCNGYQTTVSNEEGKNYTYNFSYNYSIKFKDGKLRIDNPVFTYEGYGFEGYDYFQAVNNAKDLNVELKKDKLKMFKKGFESFAGYMNTMTEDILKVCKEKSTDNPAAWKISDSLVCFTLNPSGVSNSTGNSYIAYETPGLNREQLSQAMTSLFNLFNRDYNVETLLPMDYLKELYCDKGYSKELVNGFFKTHICGYHTSAGSCYKLGPVQKFEIEVANGIQVSKGSRATIRYVLEMIYADGRIKIYNPVITSINEGVTGGIEGIVGYKFAQVKTGIFNEKDNSILAPLAKISVEQYFHNLYALIYAHLTGNEFIKLNEW